MPGSPLIVHWAAWAELDPVVAYRIAALRAAVFVVEQRCPYLDLDDRDLEPDARHYWMESLDGSVTASLRLLRDRDPFPAWRIGRVVTAASHRNRGLAAMLLEAVLDREGPFVLDAQSHLCDYYRRFGFSVNGPEFVEDGIPHLPMLRS